MVLHVLGSNFTTLGACSVWDIIFLTAIHLSLCYFCFDEKLTQFLFIYTFLINCYGTTNDA